MTAHYLEPLFAPRSIALFGASNRPDAVGGIVYRNLLDAGFPGPVVAINPKHDTVQGRPAFASLAKAGVRIDLAVVATPAKTIPAIVDECGEHGVPMMLILSAGFRETGDAGRRLEADVVNRARQHGIRLMGPNCLGVIRPSSRVNLIVPRQPDLRQQ